MENQKMLGFIQKDFHSTLGDSARNLRDDQDYINVTLAFDDDKQIQANKFMLSISSPFFRRVFKHNPQSHPLLYLQGIQSENVRKIIDFIYTEEVCIPESELDEFMSSAKDLGITGVAEDNSEGDLVSEITITEESKPIVNMMESEIKQGQITK